MRTFGNTLTDLQSGTNADKALDYSRANAQDAINQQRLEAFLRLRGQQLQTQAQENNLAANRAQRMAELLQQNRQFDISEGNRMKLGEMDAKSRLDVAKAMAEGRGLDSRLFQSFADIQELNNSNLNKVRYAKQLSDARKAAVQARNAPMTSEEDTFGWGNAPYKKRVADLDSVLANLDLEAAKLGLGRAADGGYIVPDFTPIVPPTLPVTGGRSAVPAMLAAPDAASSSASIPQGDVTLGGVPLNNFIDTAPVIPSQPETNRFRWTPNGVVAY